jgi:hypothetical protein
VFVEKFELYATSMNPKHIWIPQDISIEEVAKCLGLIVSKNCHSYVFNQDPVLIEKIENLWMVIHQKRCVLAIRVVSLGFARGIAMEMARKLMN